MPNMRYGDIIALPSNNTLQMNKIYDVLPIKFDPIEERWLVCAQDNATHMLIVTDMSRNIDDSNTMYIMVEIGKCDNLYLLADAMVE